VAAAAAAFQRMPSSSGGGGQPRPAVQQHHDYLLVSRPTAPPIDALAFAAAAAAARRSMAARMFDGPPPEDDSEDDVFAQLSESLTPMQKKLRDLSPLAMGATANSITVLSALVAWFLTPPVGRGASLGTLLAGGYGGRRVSKAMRQQRRGVVPAAIADMVRENGVEGLKASDVEKLQARYDVDPVEFEAQLSDVYARYLRQLLDSDESAPAQIRELAQLRRGIGLRWNATEAVHVAEVSQVLGETITLEPNAVEELPAELGALLWLSTGLFGTSKGQVGTEALEAAMALDERAAERVVAGVSTPFYRKAVMLAVGKYNRTEAPAVLQTARKALALSERAAASVHTEIYDAQLRVLLPDESAKLDEEAMSLLGELEGILQVRAAGSRLQAVTQPLFDVAAKEVLETAFEAPGSPVAMWGQIALRQTELSLPTAAAQATLTELARRLVTDKLVDAANLHAQGMTATSLADLARVLQYAQFVGEMMAVSGGYEEVPAADLAARYLGALALPAEAEAAVASLAREATASGVTSTPTLAEADELLKQMLCLSDPAYADARKQYAALLDTTLDSGTFDAAAGSSLDAAASELALPPALAQKLGVDAYYGWLVDTSEKGDPEALSASEAVRATLRVGPAALAELHANTNVDEMLLSSVAETLLAEETPLSAAAEQTLTYLERQLGARPGVAAAIVAGAAEA